MNVLLTGGIGAGKSTAVRRALALAAPPRVAGLTTFFTAGPGGGRELWLADWHGGGRVCARPAAAGAGLTLERGVFDALGVELLRRAEGAGLLVIDELGVIEQAESEFVAAVGEAWRRHACVLAVIQRRALPFWLPRLEDASVPRRLLDLDDYDRDRVPALVAEILRVASR